jgi:hypothetical protein
VVYIMLRKTTDSRRIPERAPGSFNEELALRVMANRIRRREVRYLEKLATKYRLAKSLDYDSPYNASMLSIPDFVPPMPNQGPNEINFGFSTEGPSSNPFRPAGPDMSDVRTANMEDGAAVIEELAPPTEPPVQPEPPKEAKSAYTPQPFAPMC